jgi:hypothetical protein
MKKDTIGCLVHCTVCDWNDEGYTTARDSARQHSRKTGHKVIGEETIAFEYCYVRLFSHTDPEQEQTK